MEEVVVEVEEKNEQVFPQCGIPSVRTSHFICAGVKFSVCKRQQD